MKNLFLSVIVAGATVLCGAATLEQVSVRQAWPWNAKVIIAYNLTLGEGEGPNDVTVTIKDGSGATVVSDAKAFSGDLSEVGTGAHTICWDPAKAGLSKQPEFLYFTLTAEADEKRYCVIDISDTENHQYSVSYLSVMPAATWPQDCLTTKIVFRHIKPGTFMMNAPETETGYRATTIGNDVAETRHQVTLTKGFYIGVFPLTHIQSRNVVPDIGSKPGWYTDTMVAMDLSFNQMMGASESAAWCSAPMPEEGSFIHTLASRITTGSLPEGMHLSLPTEAQWEYACRAGTDAAYNDGSGCASAEDVQDLALDALGVYGKYMGHSPAGEGYSVTVDALKPNAWGLYAFHGFAREWVLDGHGLFSAAAVTDPFVATTLWPVIRGGAYNAKAADCRCSSRCYRTRSNGGWDVGARLAIIPNWN